MRGGLATAYYRGPRPAPGSESLLLVLHQVGTDYLEVGTNLEREESPNCFISKTRGWGGATLQDLVKGMRS